MIPVGSLDLKVDHLQDVSLKKKGESIMIRGWRTNSDFNLLHGK
jgi:phosphopantetheine adenylyltransferase